MSILFSIFDDILSVLNSRAEENLLEKRFFYYGGRTVAIFLNSNKKTAHIRARP